MTAPTFPVLYYPMFEPPGDWFRSHLLFFDQIQSIVPADAKFEPSDEFSRVIELIPDAFHTVAPDRNDISFDDVNLKRLEKAFRQISEHRPSTSDGVTIDIAEDGSCRILGIVGLHRSKTNAEIRRLLEKYKLITPEFETVYGEPGEYLPTNAAASNLLLSHIADNMCRRSGVPTITDQQVEFTLNSFNALNVTRDANATSKLASAIIKIEVPREITDVPASRYKEIREFYSEIREPFHNMIAQLSAVHRLDSISDEKELNRRISELTVEFDVKFAKLKASQFGRSLEQWVPIGIGSVLTIIGAGFEQPVMKWSTIAASIGLEIYGGLAGQGPVMSESERVQRLIGKLREDILEASPLTMFA